MRLAAMLATAHGFGAAAEKLGVVAAAALVAIVVLARPLRVSERGRAAAMLAVLALTPVLLATELWHTSQLVRLRGHPAEALAAAALAAAVVAALAVLVHRRPQAFALLAVGALPFRLPVSAGGGTANLLIPLYLVVGGGALAYLAPRLRGAPIADGAPLRGARPTRGDWRAWLARPCTLEWLLMGSVVLYALQSCYSSDFSKALENVVFFYVPFALLFALLREVRWTRELLLGCLALAVALAVVFAGVGFVEYHRKQLFLNPKVVAANEYDNYFRVNSLFFDPNIYGRFLALTMLGVTAGVLWSARRREVLLGAALLLWLLAGLVTSFSQSSIAALLLGLAVLAAYRWDARATIYVAVAATAIAAVVALAAPPSLHLGLRGRGSSASNATSGRTKLIAGGLRLFADRPLEGFGAGSFAREYRAHEHVSDNNATSASHTIPVTVAAEQGIVGLALYVALLASAFAVLFAGAGETLRAGRAPPGAAVAESEAPGAAAGAVYVPHAWPPAARALLAACFAALVLHTFAYADFLEDPLTWTLLGIGVALATARLQAPAPDGSPGWGAADAASGGAQRASATGALRRSGRTVRLP